MKQEFDQYIDGYRSNCDKSLRLSGETSAYFAEYKAKKLAEWFPSKVLESGKILDFGCGDGVMTHFVRNQFPRAQLYGVDPSPKSVEEARRQFNGILFSLNSDERPELDFSSSLFDLIFSAGVFHHIPFDKHDAYLTELFRILKPNGALVLFELNPLNPLTTLTFKRNPIDQDAALMSPWYTKKLVRKYGRSSTKFYCFFPRFLKWLRPAEPLLTKVPFGALYATLVCK
ncbi:MAG: class I SAM-dependent methyltransferase [Chlamydiales bacterium]